MNSNVTFELTPKSNPQGKVFEPGEGETGIKVVDQYFFTETPDMKGTRRVLKAPIVRKTITKLFEIDPIALVSEEIHSIHVMGDEIEIVFGCSNKYLEPIYEFVVALTEELVE
jgi:hypothetical protein